MVVPGLAKISALLPWRPGHAWFAAEQVPAEPLSAKDLSAVAETAAVLAAALLLLWQSYEDIRRAPTLLMR
jgi:hypothetical protein